MMADGPVRRTVYYRRAHFGDGVRQSLQQLTSHALTNQSRIVDRLESLNQQGTELRVISAHKTADGFLFGRLTTYERGAYQAVIDDDPSATTLPLSSLKPPKKGQTQQQFVPGILYFAIHKNHVALAQSAALRGSGLEQHLTWLLRSRTTILGAEDAFFLMDEPAKATRERIRKSHVTSITIGRAMMDESQVQGRKSGKGSTQFRLSGDALSLLGGLLDEDRFERLGLEDQVFDSNLEVWLQIRYPRYQRVKPAASMRLLDELGIALRDVDEEQARLKLADGSIVHGKELKMKGHVEAGMSRGLPDEEALFGSMRHWVRELIRNGAVDPD